MKLKKDDRKMKTPIDVKIDGRTVKYLEGSYHAKTGKAFGWGCTESQIGTFKDGVPHGICKNLFDLGSDLMVLLCSDYVWCIL